MYKKNWKPSKAKAQEFKKQMELIEDFCVKNGIEHSKTFDSYYFTINNQDYRVSNHSVESSNKNSLFFNGYEYHEGGRKSDVIYIHASKTRIIEIYNNLLKGYKLDGKGNIKV